MQFEHAFELVGTPTAVIEVFENVPLVAGFLPGASVGERREDGSYPGQLQVTFGPKRLNFKGSLVNTVQREALAGTLRGQAGADVRGAKMAVSMRYQLSATAYGTRVELVSEAELTGILAEFARTGGVVLTQALLDEFAKHLSEHMRAQQATVPDGIDPTPSPQPVKTRPLSVWRLLWQVIKSALGRRSREGG